MPLWNEVLSILNQEPLFLENAIIEKKVIDETNFLFKIRSRIESNLFFQIRYRQTDAQIRYSYQLFSNEPIIRWDNSPYFPGLDNFPHHFHDEIDTIKSNKLTGEILVDLNIVLSELKEYYNSKVNK